MKSRSSFGGKTRPGMPKSTVRRSPRNGTPPETSAAASTPGIARTLCRTSSSRPRLRCCASCQLSAPVNGRMRTVRTSRGSIPRSTLATRAKLARNKPAPTSSTTARATSSVTSMPRSHWCAGVADFARITSAIAPPVRGRENWRTGAALKPSPLATATAAIAASTRRSTAIAATLGTSGGMAARSTSVAGPRQPDAELPSRRATAPGLRSARCGRDPPARRPMPSGWRAPVFERWRERA